ncbi:Gfo/Idh/MocA family protein [Fodinibius salsisoli]|uniref:Gfo/Idh/MocA family oxidoreductase n=1 Tax=Fodinibius salsisoli TaxID=2820877 RepID=A0ABT3PLM0_9BACT|nr:Gfo/Idh/MocA family oxidoreductase [Fodinibius salsisoli]MCW9706848.1 Gfo/Idh/MocA family oxidoreductase [Fodinibius salsisoli]
METNYKLGLVGCGSISGTHAAAIADTQDGTLTAAYSRTESRLEEFCEQYEVQGYSEYDQFLSEADIDTVVICTPSGTHLDYGMQAARAGKHVIVEKPVEVTLERAQALIDCCKEEGVKLAVIYQNRFIEDIQKMKEVVSSGSLGKPVMVDASVKWFRNQEYYDSGGWRGTLDLDGGGAVINQAIHTVDLMLWMCGEVESLQAFKGTLTHESIEGEDNAVAALQFNNGAIGVFHASTSVVPAQDRKIEIHAQEGTACLKGDVLTITGVDSAYNPDNNNGEMSGAGADDPMAGMSHDNHRKQYDQILKAFREDTEPVVSGKESLKSLAFVEALYKSSEQQTAVCPQELYAKFSVEE